MNMDALTSRIRLRHLHCFVAVATERHLGRAAEKLRLSQPAVSKTLAELEDIVGVRLFRRGRLGAALTRDGEAFLPHAVAVLEALSAAGNAVARETTPKTEAVYVGALPTVAPDLLPVALDAFRALRPDTKVVVQTAANTPLLDMLKTGAVDFVVGRMADPDMMVGLSFELLYVEPLVLAVRPGHPLLRVNPITLNAVLNFPLVVFTKGTIPRHNTESFLASRGLRLPANCLETLSISLGRLVTQRSQAVWFAPAGALREDLQNDRLAQLSVPTDGTEEPVGLLSRTEGSLTLPAQDLIKALREAAAARRLSLAHAAAAPEAKRR